MSTYGTKANQQANQTYGSQATTANQNAQQDVTQFNANTAKLDAGQNVAANPYMSPTYLAAVNRLRSGALNQQNNAADQQLRANNARTGGMNSTATTGAIGKLALQKAQLGNELGAQQTASDWQKNVGYQQSMAQMPLDAAKIEGGLYNTATGGQSDALKNLTSLQTASYGPWMAAIQAAGGGIGGALLPKGGK